MPAILPTLEAPRGLLPDPLPDRATTRTAGLVARDGECLGAVLLPIRPPHGLLGKLSLHRRHAPTILSGLLKPGAYGPPHGSSIGGAIASAMHLDQPWTAKAALPLVLALSMDSIQAASRGYALGGSAPDSRSAALTAQAQKSEPATLRAGAGTAGAASLPEESKTATAPRKTPAKTPATKKPATTKPATKKPVAKKASSTSSELAFLDDAHMSVEEKLYRFMALMTKKADGELVQAMKDYEERKAASDVKKASEKAKGAGASSQALVADGAAKTQESGGGGILGALGDLVGGAVSAVAGSLESTVEGMAKAVGGPLLAAGATAIGLPFLAPVAMKLGGDLGAQLVGGAASALGLHGKRASAPPGDSAPPSLAPATNTSSPGASGPESVAASAPSSAAKKPPSAASNTSAAEGEGEFDEKLAMFNLQRLVEKQAALFAALSNAMKASHDAQMTAVQNIR